MKMQYATKPLKSGLLEIGRKKFCRESDEIRICRYVSYKSNPGGDFQVQMRSLTARCDIILIWPIPTYHLFSQRFTEAEDLRKWVDDFFAFTPVSFCHEHIRELALSASKRPQIIMAHILIVQFCNKCSLNSVQFYRKRSKNLFV